MFKFVYGFIGSHPCYLSTLFSIYHAHTVQYEL